MNLKNIFVNFLFVFALPLLNCVSCEAGGEQISSRIRVGYSHQNLNLTGNNLEWIYHRNGEPYYFIGSEATNNRTFRERFHFTSAPGSEGQTHSNQSIQLTATVANTYLWMDATGHLKTTEDFAKRSFFELIPADNGRFYVYFNGEPLVSRSSRSPLVFSTLSNYPDEQPAEFSIFPAHFSIKDSYRGTRNLILKTAQVIQELTPKEDRDIAYAELIQLVQKYGHLPGKEIFELGQHIFKDIGSASNSFKTLPPIVQNVCSGELLSFYFPKDGVNLFMKDHTASVNHTTDTLPYNFTSQMDSKSVVWWAITHSLDRQLYYSSGLRTIVSATKRYIFQLHLHENLNTFKIFVNINGNPPSEFHWQVGFTVPKDDYFFVISVNYPAANFTAIPFDVDVERFYAGRREHITSTAKRIQNSNSFIDKDFQYQTLIRLMTEYGHIEGKEIFEIGHIICRQVDAVGPNSAAFKLLPEIVQTVIRDSQSQRLFYNGTIPMQNESASVDYSYILPYTFTLDEETGTKWSITYGNNSQLFINNYDLKVVNSNTKIFEFELHLDSNLTGIRIYGYDKWAPAFVSLNAKTNPESVQFYFEIGRSDSLATFKSVTWTDFDVNSIYDGAYYKILETVGFIHDSTTFVNKTAAYEQLLRLMFKNKHVYGREIFDVGQFILEDLGEGSSVFALLPRIVQLVCSGRTTRLAVQTSDVGGRVITYRPLEYHWASDLHANKLPFRFEYSKPNRTYAITYADDFQLSFRNVPNSRLIDVKQTTKQYDFGLYLSQDLTTVKIMCRYASGMVVMGTPTNHFDQPNDFYFQCNVLENFQFFYLFSLEEF